MACRISIAAMDGYRWRCYDPGLMPMEELRASSGTVAASIAGGA